MRHFIIAGLCCLIWNITISQNITTAEYFFDGNDMGFGLNSSLTVNQLEESHLISTTNLNTGFHDLYIRVFDQAANGGVGSWSHSDRSTFYIADFPTGQDIVAARYFIDNATPINFGIDVQGIMVNQTNTLSIGSLDEGFHSFYIQTQDADNTWSLYDRSAFYVANFPENQDIIAARYFFDDEAPILLSVDPMSQSITESYSIPIGSLSVGFHSFYVQTQTEDLTWSLYDRQMIFVNDFSDMPTDIVAAEYFIDLDPGFGEGVSFDIVSNPLLVTTDMDITEGDHLFCVRVQNTNGDWSLYSCATFNVDNSLGINESLYKSVEISPNPFTENININTARALDINAITVFDITGKEVYSMANDMRRIDLSHLKSGVYLLSITTQNEQATFKLIKK